MPTRLEALLQEAERLQRELDRFSSLSIIEGLEPLRGGAHFIGPGPPGSHTRNLPTAVDDLIFRNLPSSRAQEIAERLSGVLSLIEAASLAETGGAVYKAGKYLRGRLAARLARPRPISQRQLDQLHDARITKALKGFGQKTPAVDAPGAVDDIVKRSLPDLDVVIPNVRFGKVFERTRRLGYKLDPWLKPRQRSWYNPMRYAAGREMDPFVRAAPEGAEAYSHFVGRLYGHQAHLKAYGRLNPIVEKALAKGQASPFTSKAMALDYQLGVSAHQLGFRTTKSEIGAVQAFIDQTYQRASRSRWAYDTLAEGLDRIPGAARVVLQSPYRAFQWGRTGSWSENVRRTAGGPTFAQGWGLSSDVWRWKLPMDRIMGREAGSPSLFGAFRNWRQPLEAGEEAMGLGERLRGFGRAYGPRLHGTMDDVAPRAAQWMDKYIRAPYQTLIPGRTIWDHAYFKAGMGYGAYHLWTRDTEQNPWPETTTFLRKTNWERIQENLLVPYVFRSTNSLFLWQNPANPIQSRGGEEIARDAAGFYGRIVEGIGVSALYALGVPPGFGRQLGGQLVFPTGPSAAGDDAVRWFQESEQASRRRGRGLWQDRRTMGFFRGAAEQAYMGMVGDAPRADQVRMEQVHRRMMRAASGIARERATGLDVGLETGNLQALMKDRYGSGRSMAGMQLIEEMKVQGYRSLRSGVNLDDPDALRGLSIPSRYYWQDLKPWQRRGREASGMLFPGADLKSLMEGQPEGARSFYQDNDRIEGHVRLQRLIYVLDAGLRYKQALIYKIWGSGDSEEAQKHVREYEALYKELQGMLQEDKRLSRKFAGEYQRLEAEATQKASDYRTTIGGRTSSIGLLGPEEPAALGDLRQEAGVLRGQSKLLSEAWGVMHGDLQKKYKIREMAYSSQRSAASDAGSSARVAELDAAWNQERLLLERQIAELNEYRGRIMAIIEKQTARTRANIQRLGGTAHSPMAYSAEQWGDSSAFEYQRPRWGDADQDRRNTRDEVLAGQSTRPVIRGQGDRIQYGEWEGFYTGRKFKDAREVHVDHVMSNRWAWEHGLRYAPPEVQERFFNDKSNLVISEANENQRKGALDPRQYSVPQSMLERLSGAGGERQDRYLRKFAQTAHKYREWIDVPPDLQRMFPADVESRRHREALEGMRAGVGTGGTVSNLLGISGSDGAVLSQMLGTLIEIRELLGGGGRGSGGRRLLADRLTEQREKEAAKARRERMKRTRSVLRDYNQEMEGEEEYTREREKGSREGLGEFWRETRSGVAADQERLDAIGQGFRDYWKLQDRASKRRPSLQEGLKGMKGRQDRFLQVQDLEFGKDIEKQLELIEESKKGLRYMEAVTNSIVRGFASALRYSRDMRETWAHIGASLLMTFGRKALSFLIGAAANRIEGLGRDAGGDLTLPQITKVTGPVELTQGRQHGGQVLSGRSYTVGEGGPEKFRARQTGVIEPAHRAMADRGARGVVIEKIIMNFNVKADDGRIGPAAAKEIRDAVVPEAANLAYAMVAQDLRRPSPFNE